MTFEERKRAVLEGIVISGLVVAGLLSLAKNDMTNAAWALGLAGGYAFKNGVHKGAKNA